MPPASGIYLPTDKYIHILQNNNSKKKKKKKEAQALLGDPGLGLVTRGLMLEVQQYSQELVRSWRPLASSHLVAMF